MGPIKLFESKKVRTHWDEDKELWYFSVIDVIEILTGTDRPRKYWNDLKAKLKKEGSELSEKIGQLLTIALLISILSCNAQEEKKTETQTSYKQLRTVFKTEIIKQIPAPQGYEEFDKLRDSISLIIYPSEGLELKGLLNLRNINSNSKSKAIVYLHGGFSLAYSEMIDCQPFIDSGFIVFAPTYRGEVGNPGYFEYFMGEVRDAENAVKWLAKQKFIYADSIYVFGHSIGGAMSLLLSLNDNCPSKLNGSSAGIYIKESLHLVGDDNIPFNPSNEKEYFFRCPVYALEYLNRTHFMYIGKDDYFQEISDALPTLNKNIPINFKLEGIEGDHFSSLQPAMIKFMEEIKKYKPKG